MRRINLSVSAGVIAVILLILTAECAASGGSAGSAAAYESRSIVDMPTAGVVPKSSYAVEATAFDGGGLAAGIFAAPFHNFNMGISFSGVNFIGAGDILWQEIPGIHLRYRPFDETLYIPAFTIGVSTQGAGAYLRDADRFRVHSTGVYLAASKNFRWAGGTVALHGGINYSFDPPSDSRSPNFYLGLEHSVGPAGALVVEYNANIDDGDTRLNSGKGLLSAALRWSVAPGLTLGLHVRDMLGRQKYSTGFTRFMTFEYISPF
ncbi:MAG: hypothetical protein ACOCX7_02285 [Bacteroidota bacterium]